MRIGTTSDEATLARWKKGGKHPPYIPPPPDGSDSPPPPPKGSGETPSIGVVSVVTNYNDHGPTWQTLLDVVDVISSFPPHWSDGCGRCRWCRLDAALVAAGRSPLGFVDAD